MAEVKWIKIVTDIFDDEKIILIESLPEADSMIVIWFKLLCLAGKTNNKGVFTLAEKIPYTDEMFSTIFRRPVNTVRLALRVFEQYGMIEVINGVVTLPNWGKHQNESKLEAMREYNRKAKQNERSRKRQLLTGDQGNVNDSQCTDIEVDTDTDKKNEEVQGEVIVFYQNNVGLLSPFQLQLLTQWLVDGIEPKMIKKIMEDSVGKNVPWDWIKKVAETSIKSNIKTLADYESAKVARQRNAAGNNPGLGRKPERRNNFQQRNYDDDFYEKLDGLSTKPSKG